MRQQDKNLTLEREGWGGVGGMIMMGWKVEAELSLKNGAWPISKGQSPEH